MSARSSTSASSSINEPPRGRNVRDRIRLLAVMVALALPACAQLKPQKPPLPVSVTHRESMVGEGYVAQFENQSDKFLTIAVELRNETIGKKRSGHLELRGNHTTEIGWLQGWKFASGDTIAVSHADYKGATYRIP